MKTTKLIAVGASVLFLLAIISTATLMFQNRSLKQSVVQEQNHGTTLLAQKHALQNEIDKFNAEVSRLKGKNKELDGSLAEATDKLTLAQRDLNRLFRENKDKKQIQNKLQEVQALKDELAGQIMALNARLDKLNEENLALNNMISSLKNENQEMAANLQMMQSVLANNFLIEALQGRKDKLTVRAKRAGKINVDFEIPATIQSQIHFKIVKPDGIVLDSKKDKNFTMTAMGPSTGLMASSAAYAGMPIKTKKISLTYKPDSKLRPGIYTIEVYNNDTYLGASQIKLK